MPYGKAPWPRVAAGWGCALSDRSGEGCLAVQRPRYNPLYQTRWHTDCGVVYATHYWRIPRLVPTSSVGGALRLNALSASVSAPVLVIR